MKWFKSLSRDDKALLLEVSFIVGSIAFSALQVYTLRKEQRRRSEAIDRLEKVFDKLDGMTTDELLDEANRLKK